MSRRSQPAVRSRRSRSCVLALLALALIAYGATAAVPAVATAAGPTEATMSLADLRAAIELDADHSVPGYFKTVLRGDDIVQIPCNILGVVDNALWDNSALILFEATGPDADRIGGIAQGMSGSPLFVDDTIDSLVGAVSYGDGMTRNNLGLATPIEPMIAIETTFPLTSTLLDAPAPQAVTGTAALAAPVRTESGRVVESITLAPTFKAARTVEPAANGTVMAPLMTAYVGGLPPQSKAFKRIADRFAEKGVNVRAVGSGGADPSFETALVGGAAVGAVIAYGDFWIGGVGTVTYAHDDVVVAFGHPLWNFGETSLFLTNARIEGVWASNYVPYKLATLGKIRGEFVQDRAYGSLGRVGASPATVTMSSSATMPPDPTTVTASTDVPRDLDDDTYIQSMVAAGTTEMPVVELLNVSNDDWVWLNAFSAKTHLEATVNDGTSDLSLTRDNMADELWMMSDDSFLVVETLLSNPGGTAPATLVSLDTTSEVALARRETTILDVQVPGGIQRGLNTVKVTVRDYGQVTPTVHDVPLTIPAGVGLKGEISIDGGIYYGYYGYCCDSGWIEDGGHTLSRTNRYEIEPPPSVADLVAEIQDTPQNNDLVVTWWPEDMNEEDYYNGTGWVETAKHTESVAYGWVAKSTADVELWTVPLFVPRGTRTVLKGTVMASRGEAGTVQIYRVGTSGDPDKLLATVDAVRKNRMLAFSYRTPRLSKTTRFKAVWSGNEDYIASYAKQRVRVF